MCLYVQNISEPTSSVAVAFKSRHQLKLVFSSDPDEDWISWPTEQLQPYVSYCSFPTFYVSSCQFI